MESVKSAGIDAIEFWAWQGKDLDAVRAAKDGLGMEICCICTSEFTMNDPSKRASYLEGLKRSIEAAQSLGCKKLITQVGGEIPGVSREEQKKSIIDCLRKCSAILEEAESILMVEPLNLFDHKGYYLPSSEEAAEIVRDAGSPCVRILFDIYHQQITEGNLLSRIKGLLPLISHFHCAGVPGRHELNFSEINYSFIFNEIEKLGYDGYAGLEYFPIRDPKDGLIRACAEKASYLK
jgi:hydroxypyruvate isomerase